MSAAQHSRVAGFQAQACHVHGDVRTSLVNHADDADGHTHLVESYAVGQAVAADDLADRVGQGCDMTHSPDRHPDTRLIELETVELALIHAVTAGLKHVGGIGLGDIRRMGVECIRNGAQRLVLLVARGTGERRLRVSRLVGAQTYLLENLAEFHSVPEYPKPCIIASTGACGLGLVCPRLTLDCRVYPIVA